MQKFRPKISYRYREIVKKKKIFRSPMTSMTMLASEQNLSNYIDLVTHIYHEVTHTLFVVET